MQKVHNDGVFELILEKTEKPNYIFRLTNWEDYSWEIDDPYKYSPVLTDFDFHLFNEGNHYRIYEKLGSHIIEHEGAKGVLYSVWAPNAKRVSVIGNFNRWDGRRNMMRNRGGSGVWEIFIPGHTEGEIYKFEIKTQDDRILEKADPYAI